MRIVLTGGHITPAIALIPYLRSHKLLFILRKHAYEGDSGLSFEYKTIQELGVDFRVITTGRLQRSFTLHTIPSLLKFPIGLLQSFRILLGFRPHVVLSFGGYVALPVCLAAFLLGIPVITHEQTIQIGLANRIIGVFAKKICVSFKETLSHVPKGKGVLTGNPIRTELFHVSEKPPFLLPTSFPILYITGGSGGSQSINEFVGQILENLLAKYVVIHQTGETSDSKLLEMERRLPSQLKKRYIRRLHVQPVELSWIYANASLLVGRSGANTVYEILAFGQPALLIPLPWAGGSEQEVNARLIEKVGLGRVLKQEGLHPRALLSVIDEMVADSNRYKRNKRQAEQLVIPNAHEKIVSVLEEAVEQ